MSDFQKYLDLYLSNIKLDNDAADDAVESYDVFGEIREAILSIRRENHLTQKELAEKAGITQANLSNIEKGISKPSIDSLKKIADATGTRLVIDFKNREEM
ncbi:MAG: helix-turn-helix domain-containing protein [Saccharofermentans sp.]|nr:helix-turn-helix domain-containing protein [Saccharofermentans sp.]